MGCRELCPVLGEEATEEHIVSHEFYINSQTRATTPFPYHLYARARKRVWCSERLFLSHGAG